MASSGAILVVDDEEMILDLVQMALEDEGYEVVTAGNGATALDAIGLCCPKLILLDMRMPVMNGGEFVKNYRETPKPHAPVVLMTAARDARQKAVDLGADAHLGKPFGLDELIDLVRKHVPETATTSPSLLMT